MLIALKNLDCMFFFYYFCGVKIVQIKTTPILCYWSGSNEKLKENYYLKKLFLFFIIFFLFEKNKILLF